MKIVIVGDGKVGFALTAQLAQEGHDIVVIDNNKKVLQESAEQLAVMVDHGNGGGGKAQKQPGVEDADPLIAATSADEINLLCCIVARKLGSAHTIATVRNPEYVEQIYFLKDELGLSMTINPERAAAREISRLLQFPSFLKRDSFAKGRAEIVEMVIKEGSVLEDKLLSELYQIAKVQVLVCAVKRGGRAYIPDGSFRLMRGDRIFVTAPTHNLARLIKHLGLQTQKIREVILVGGSSIAYYLAMDLFLNGIRVKIIESQAERCLELAELLPKAMIIHGDGANQSVLLAEGIEKTDAVVTLTNLDEENFLVSMYANYLKVPKVITKINRTEFNDIFQDKGIDCVVSPKLLTANDIVRYVRAMQNKTGDSMITLHRIADDMAEAMESPVTEETRHLGETLIKIRLRPNILIACINRRGKIIIPKGDDTIELNDTVIVVTTAEQRINELNDIFEDPA